VLDVFVDGEALRRDGITLTVDENSARETLNEAVIDYYAEL
jgi:Fe-S cluster assembly iron-binding protein IscA